MQQLSSLVTVFTILIILSSNYVTRAAHNGNWSEVITSMFIGPLAVFFLLHTFLYLGARLLRGREGVASYTGSKINCVAALMTILTTLAVGEAVAF